MQLEEVDPAKFTYGSAIWSPEGDRLAVKITSSVVSELAVFEVATGKGVKLSSVRYFGDLAGWIP